ncbi:hypothetical protein [Streptacidiphilus carbonis]|uniref:hypothetical protein n=1 Tax=Streptacidiphilus carbonis TaxID=105422 RepID=UPI0005A836D1|nr:hypothetical protein [Streptacidiphilus carbonis]
MSTTAKLIYGYRLRADEDGWQVKEIHPKDSDLWGLNLDWLGEDDEFQDKAEERLMAAVGYEEGDFDADPDAWRQRRRDAEARIGVEFEHGGYQFGDLFLSAKKHSAYLGELTVIDPAVLAAEANAEADERLRAALAVLGLTPLEERPAWLLTACRG